MTDLLQVLTDTLRRLNLQSLLDILIIAGLFYWLLLLLRRTTAMALLRGAAIVFIVAFIFGRLLDLRVLNWLVRNSLTGLLIATPIIFQPELRRALERLGRTTAHSFLARPYYRRVVDVIAEVSGRLAGQRVGALIVIERETGLEAYLDTGTRLEALISSPLLEAIFQHGSPLHDGAVIIRGDRIVAASCMLPLSERAVPGHVGARHRAALGITEQTDALSVLISEETGEIGLAANGRLLPTLDVVRLRSFLLGLLSATTERDVWLEAGREPTGAAGLAIREGKSR